MVEEDLAGKEVLNPVDDGMSILQHYGSTLGKERKDDQMKPKTLSAVVCLVIVGAGTICMAEDREKAETENPSLLQCETLTNNWFGLGEKLAEKGISVGLGATQIYQQNLHGGMSTHRRAGRYTGSYDLEAEFDLEKLMNVKGGLIFLHAEGSWSDGLDASSIGSIFGVNGDAAGDRSMDLTELYYEQTLLGDKLTFRIGKLDVGGGFECRGCPVAFDGSAFANDETSQFLNAALVNNPTIPMPDNGLAAVVHTQPLEWWYVSAGVADAQADARETGFNTAFHGEDHFFSIFETGVAPRIQSVKGPLQGTYRAGFWYDPQPKDKHNGGTKRDDMGFYLSLDQMVLKENADDDDPQGLGLFARYGWADKDVSEIECFWSAGAQYQGLIPTRDDDVLGFGVARGRFVEDAGFTRDHETAMELYYNTVITPWLSISPSMQYVFSPGGDNTVDDAVVLGFRMQMSF